MSEQNILNPTIASQLCPDFPLALPGLNPQMATFQPMKGKVISRLNGEQGNIFAMTWNKRSLATRDALVQWEAQYRQGFFTFYHIEKGRYYSGRFADKLQVSQVGYEQWNISGTFVELPGKPMFAYPTTWGIDSIFYEERDDDGVDLITHGAAGTGFTLLDTNPGIYHGAAGTAYLDGAVGHYVEWQYFGYGFRLWGPLLTTGGTGAVSVDGGAATNVSFHSGSTVASAALFTNANLPLGTHRVKLAVVSGTFVPADAIEVMQ